MQVNEGLANLTSRVLASVETYSGQAPTEREVALYYACLPLSRSRQVIRAFRFRAPGRCCLREDRMAGRANEWLRPQKVRDARAEHSVPL